MILSGKEIEKRLGKDIIITPYDPSRLNPNSYNLYHFSKSMEDLMGSNPCVISLDIFKVKEKWYYLFTIGC